MLLSGAVIDESLFAPFVQDQRPFELASALDLPLNNPALLRLALTHRSILHEWAALEPDRPLPHSNERLEFLGDAYLAFFGLMLLAILIFLPTGLVGLAGRLRRLGRDARAETTP